jgi:hypothetical protein
MKLNNIGFERVQYMPKQLQPGILYVSDEFETAAHLCACGCGVKVVTPLGPTDWAYRESLNGVSLWPSVGNWQQPCESHYIIDDGEIIWCGKWTLEQIMAGRKREQQRSRAYYRDMYADQTLFGRILKWARSMISGN